MKKIYIASPLGFSESGRKFYYETLIPLMQKNGFSALDPWTLTPRAKIREVVGMEYGKEKREAWKNLNRKFAENNIKSIDSSDGLLAILDGPDVDSGTASEIGYAFAKGKKIVGYRGDFRLSADNEGSVVNLQVEYFIYKSGGKIVSAFSEIIDLLKKTFNG